MPEILQKANGDTDWTKLFMGFAVALVVIIQQFQTYHIADLKAQAAIQERVFMPKERVLRKEAEALKLMDVISDRLDKIEELLKDINEAR